ncbi:TonB-dependent receptor [Mariniphaga sediminis]|uniref:TonB-dependent receptor n=1 Tax=Mariniphaga sediminis TaxID=1628158 RepID=A0A399D8T3_9BACT|nr:TonB-dependent receptor plug domain-containing protein [Mariniphaga sediminis]RIH66620.1 TonB-dependent receptor [Mariniphaga sediminis]
MRRTLIVSLLLLMAFTAVSQPKTRGKVKRKYRNVERTRENAPQVVFRGLVRDAAKAPISGACVEIEGLKRLVHTNEFGQFMISNLPGQRLRIKVSCLGYQTKTIDYMFQAGYNDHYIALDRGPVPLESAFSTAQKREQQIPDLPAALFVVNESFAKDIGVTDFSEMAGFIPGLGFERLGAGKAGFSIYGANGSSGFPEVSPSVAVFSDQVPLSYNGRFFSDLFDMDRTEVLKGPQNVLFGRNAVNGAVHFISKKPEEEFGGYITAGAGNFGNKEVQAAVNLPVMEDILFVRAAGLFRDRNGYVENTSGGSLSGKNVLGGRFSVRFLPAWNHKIDLQLNYQKNDEPGVALMNRWFPNDEGETGIFSYRASVNNEEQAGSEMELMDATLTYRLFRDEHNYWTSVSSYRKNNSASHWDADGTSLSALEMSNKADATLFFQEIRYNFVRWSQTHGSFGVSYFQEKGNFSQDIFSNDEQIYSLISVPENFLLPGQSPFPVNPGPLEPEPMASFPFSGDHNEAVFNERMTQSAQAFLHYTYQWKQRLFFTLGARAVYDRLQLTHESVFTDGEASSLGTFSGAEPNLFFSPAEQQKLTKNSLSFTAQAGLAYRWNENFNFYLNAARGRRPQALQFSWEGKPLIAGAEKVYSGEAGWKTIIKKRVFWNANGFYRRHFNVQTLQGAGEPGTALLAANGKATSYGAETGLRVAVIPALDLFGNYTWMQSAFDSTGVDGKDYQYAGNHFAKAPEHSFSAGFTAKISIVHRLRLFATPWYTWNSHFWFTEANTSGLDQPAYGVLNINLGLEMDEPNVVLSVYGSNLLEEEYIASAGHWGGQLGFPTFIPGPPRMLGMRVTWRF